VNPCRKLLSSSVHPAYVNGHASSRISISTLQCKTMLMIVCFFERNPYRYFTTML
jgi:hypothetical protein